LIEELGEHGNDLVHSIKMWDVLAKRVIALFMIPPVTKNGLFKSSVKPR
jgi:type III secretory pathway component EscT